MPIYEYECPQCGPFEQIQKVSEPTLKTCPTCRRKVTKKISTPALHFKGEGFWVTDYGWKSKNKEGGAASSKDAGSGSESSGGEGGGSAESKEGAAVGKESSKAGGAAESTGSKASSSASSGADSGSKSKKTAKRS